MTSLEPAQCSDTPLIKTLRENLSSRATLFKSVGLVLLLGFVFYAVDLTTVSKTFRGMSPQTLILLASCFGIAFSLRLIKWSLQAVWSGFRFVPQIQLRNFVIGLLLGAITPLRAGELYRISALEGHSSRQPYRGLAAAALVLEKGYELTVVLALIAIGGWLSGEHPLFPLGFGTLVLIALLFGIFSTDPPAQLRNILPKRLDAITIGPLLAAREAMETWQRLVVLGLGGLAHLANIWGGLLIYRAFGEMSVANFFFRVPFITLINLLPVTIGGIGLRELSAMELFGAIGYPASSAAVAASLLFIGANIVPALVVLPIALAWGVLRPPKPPPQHRRNS